MSQTFIGSVLEHCESEIVRHGIELVRREVAREKYSKYRDGSLAKCHKQMK